MKRLLHVAGKKEVGRLASTWHVRKKKTSGFFFNNKESKHLKNVSASVVDCPWQRCSKSNLNDFLKWRLGFSQIFLALVQELLEVILSHALYSRLSFKICWENAWAKLAAFADWYLNFLKASWVVLIYTSFWSCPWNIFSCCHYTVTPRPCLFSMP